MTELRISQTEFRVPRNVKSAKDSMVVACFECQDESHAFMKKNYKPYADKMFLHEQGLAARPQLNALRANLKSAQEKLSAPGLGAAQVEHLQRQVDTLTGKIVDFMKDAADKGWMEHVEGRGYFFVEWHAIMDMACMREERGVTGAGSKSMPCGLCKKLWTNFEHLHLGPGELRQHANAVFPLPVSRIHACAMHCKHRVTERFLWRMMLWLDEQAALHKDNPRWQNELQLRRDNLMQVLNTKPGEKVCVTASSPRPGVDRKKVYVFKGIDLNGGKCRWQYDQSSKMLCMISMNGDEAQRFIDQMQLLFEYVYSDISSLNYGLWTVAVEGWVKLLEEMSKFNSDPDASVDGRLSAMELAPQFVKDFRAAAGPKSVTYYLHMLHDHPGWFFCVGADNKFSTVAWWSAQCVEAGHKLRKKVLRSHTRHGMAIKRFKVDPWTGEVVEEIVTLAPAMYELFRWQFRMLGYKKIAARADADAELVRVNLTQLNSLGLHRLGAQHEWTEQEILASFRLPGAAKIRIIGYGKLTVQGLKVKVSQCTYAAESKFADLGGCITDTDKNYHKGRQPWALLPEEAKEAKHSRDSRRKAGFRAHALAQTGFSSYDDLFLSGTDRVKAEYLAEHRDAVANLVSAAFASVIESVMDCDQ